MNAKKEIASEIKFSDLSFKWRFLIGVGVVSLFLVFALVVFIILIFKTDLISLDMFISSKIEGDNIELEKFTDVIDEWGSEDNNEIEIKKEIKNNDDTEEKLYKKLQKDLQKDLYKKLYKDLSEKLDIKKDIKNDIKNDIKKDIKEEIKKDPIKKDPAKDLKKKEIALISENLDDILNENDDEIEIDLDNGIINDE